MVLLLEKGLGHQLPWPRCSPGASRSCRWKRVELDGMLSPGASSGLDDKPAPQPWLLQALS